MSFETYLQSRIDMALLKLHTAQLCKVLSFDPVARTCDLQPLFQKVKIDGTAETLSPITSAPVLRQQYRVNGSAELYEYVAEYLPGQTVLTVALERAIDHVLAGEPADPKFDRRHHLTDVIVLGVVG